MKIAVYYNLDYGGAKRAVQEHVKGLSKLGHQVDVYTIDEKSDNLSPSLFSNEEFQYAFKPLQIKVPVVCRIAYDLSVFLLLKNLHKKIALDIDRKKYDIVLLHADHYTQSPYLSRCLKTKNVYYVLEPLRIVHEYALGIPSSWNIFNRIYESLNRYIRNKIDLENARSATYSLAISYVGKFYAGLAYDIYPKVSYLGVDEKLFKKINIKKKNQIFYVAPKDYLFGYDLITKAIQFIPDRIRPELKVIFGANQKNRLSDRDVVREYNQSVATVSLSRLDTFGLVPLESMACTTPVIVLDMPGYREIVEDDITGFLVEPDPKQIAQKIKFLIENPKEAQEMGLRGRKIIENKWTWEKQIKNLEKMLIEFVNQ